MKTTSFQLKMLRSLLLIPVLMFFIAGNANAQEHQSKENTGKQKYSIHIVKEVNGEKTEIDTTFESKDDFDVDAWVEKHNMGNERQEKMKKIEKELTVTIPQISEDAMKSMPDTIIVNGDTVIVNTRIEKNIMENPEPGEMDDEEFSDKQMEERQFPEHGNRPEGCHHEEFPGMERMMPYRGFNFPGLENLLPFGNLDQIVIKKKKHGKKVIITFVDNDNDNENIIIRPGMNDPMYYNHHGQSQMNPSKGKRVVIKKEITPGDDVQEGDKVERYKDGDKEVIIIHRNSDGKK